MSKAAELLAECEELGITVEPRPKRNSLWVKPISSLTPDLKRRLVKHKPSLLWHLTHRPENIENICTQLMKLGLYRKGKTIRIRKPEALNKKHRLWIAKHSEELAVLLTPREIEP